jgi:hypothetical protein
MKDTEYIKLLEFTPINGVLVPSNQNSVELLSILNQGEVQLLQNVTARDLKFHKAYFSLLNFIWCAMPVNFRGQVPMDKFYLFLKAMKKDFSIIFEFKDGFKLVEYESISFGRMSQATFKMYVAEQIPFIYDLIQQVYKDPKRSEIVIESIEEQYKKFLSKL